MDEDEIKIGEPKPVHRPEKREVKYEMLVGQLILAILVGIFLALGAGFLVGKEVGLSKSIGDVNVEKPDYCTVDKAGGGVQVRCNELTNVSLDSLCKWVSPELKGRIRIVMIT